MATATVTKNILLFGHVNQGKITLKKALKTVLETRYGLGEEVDMFIGASGHPNTVKLTQSLNKSNSTTSPLMQSKNIPILHGDSELAIKDPFGPYGDVMVRLIHYIKVALWG